MAYPTARLEDLQMRSSPWLWSLYERGPRSHAFMAESRVEAEAWRRGLRETLAALLGEMPELPESPDPRLIESTECSSEGYRRDLIALQVQSGEYMPCYVLVPYAPPPYPTAIAVHGHGSWGARGLVGLAGSREEEELNLELNYDYARQLATRGYLVFAPVQRGFGERMEPRPRVANSADDPKKWRCSCEELAFNALLCGTTLLGLRIWDLRRLLDYVLSRPDARGERLACVGLSGGGTTTLFAAALDDRIRRAVVAGYLNTFRDSIMSIEHCACNYVPGILRLAELPDIAGLVAPRPLLVQAGRDDPIYPLAGVERALARLRRIYACYGAEGALREELFEGGHRWSGAMVYDWLGAGD